MTRRRLHRLGRNTLSALLILSIASAALPPGLLPAWLPSSAPRPAAAETVSSPRYVSAALMPNGQVGLVFQKVDGSNAETRFVRYTDEHALGQSIQLSTAGPLYPQLALIGSTLVAAYVDTRSPNVGKLILRTSTDNGASWSGESNPFGSETFDWTNFAPRVVASQNGQTLYVFAAASGAVPTYRSTTNLVNWTTAASAGNASMRVTSGNNCGSAGQECYRAHAFEFMETATTGTWVYIAKSDSGFAQSGRGTQVGTLGGSWSTQVDHGGSGGASGGGESTATTFLGRDGSVYYIRAGGYGESLYFKRSADGGATWDSPVGAYLGISNYTTGAPVGLYVAGYTSGEYVFYAGFGGTEDALRAVPLWSGPLVYPRTATVRLLGSAGSDLDAASAFPYNFGDAAAGIGAGGYSTTHTDLALPGRLLPLAFTRSYNSADPGSSTLGPGWMHNFAWSLAENGSLVTLKRGDGQRDRFTRNQDGTYANPPGVFDVLTKNADGSFTLKTPSQVSYEFGVPASAYAPLVLGGSPAGYWRLGEQTGTAAADAGPNNLGGTYSGSYALGLGGAIVADTNTSVTFGGGNADMGSPGALNISGNALSIEFWAKGSPGTYNYLVSHTNGGSQGYAVYTGGDGTYHFYIGRGGGLHITGSVSGTWDGQWHHFANVFDGSQMRVYVDGTARLSESETGTLTGYTGNFRVAGYNGGGFSFNGSLDELAVYSRALSSAEIADHYVAGIAPKGMLTRIHEPAGNQITLAYTGPRLDTITDTVGRVLSLSYNSSGQLQTIVDPAGRVVRYGAGVDGRLAFVWDQLASTATTYVSRVLANSPAAYWRLGESSGTSAADASPGGITGTYNGSLTLGATGAVAGDSNTAVSVNGGYLSASGTGLLNVTGSALSVEGWVKGSSQGTHKYIVSKSDNNGTVGYSLYTGATGTLSFFVHTSGSGLVLATAASSPWDNQWHHVVGTYDGAFVRLYVDGVRVASQAATGTITSSASVALNLGRYNGGGLAFSGSLDEFAVLPSALSEADIIARPYGRPSWQYAYDGTSRHIAALTDPDGRVVATNTFDTLGRLATQKDGLNNTTSFGYAPSQMTLTDPRGNTTTVTYDSRNRPIQQDDPVGGTTYHQYFTYDSCGNRSSVTDRGGNRSDFTFDTGCQGNLLELKEPQLNPQTPRFTTTWTYDAKNNPTQKTDAKGFVSTWTYDATTNLRLSATAPIDGSTSATTKWIYGDTANPGLPTRIVAPRGNTTGT
ncbi:MAG: LamG-like jellyroll fold domain-containing protein, partial [Candidatus Limnocylindria bacterium]